VARVQGKIVAQGETEEAALRAAKTQRYKEKVEVDYVNVDPAASLGPLIDRVAEISQDESLFLVGGAVRDALLGIASHDFDFAVPQGAIESARRVANALGAAFYVLDAEFDAARVIVPAPAGVRDVLDFSSFRGPDLAADLAGRDFTIDAMALDLRKKAILDPLKGGNDLRSKLIRACTDTSVRDDPVRLLRAIRLAAALGFKIETSTRRAMKEAASLLPEVSAERQRDELFKILGGPRPDAAVRAIEILGVFPHVLPELSALKGIRQPPPHAHDVWDHTLSVIHHLDAILEALDLNPGAVRENSLLTGLLTGKLGRYRQQIATHLSSSLNPDRSARSLLFFAALYHDVAKPTAKTVDSEGRIRFLGHEQLGSEVAAGRCRGFNLSNDEIWRIRSTVANHMRFSLLAQRVEAEGEAPSRRAIYRFFRDTGPAGVDLILLGLADVRGARGPALTDRAWSASLETARILLENYWERPQESVAPPRLVDGADLMKEFDLQQGRVVGEMLHAIREAQAAGSISTRDDALDFGWKWLKSKDK
jgi:tRNA nucleotidyltransferase/poly(A) polymerase